MRTDSFGDAGNEQRVPTGRSLVGCSRASKHFVCVWVREREFVSVCVCVPGGVCYFVVLYHVMLVWLFLGHIPLHLPSSTRNSFQPLTQARYTASNQGTTIGLAYAKTKHGDIAENSTYIQLVYRLSNINRWTRWSQRNSFCWRQPFCMWGPCLEAYETKVACIVAVDPGTEQCRPPDSCSLGEVFIWAGWAICDSTGCPCHGCANKVT